MDGAYGSHREKSGAYRVGEGTCEGDPLEDLDVDGRMILKCIFRIHERAWTGLIWLGLETRDGMM